MVVLSWRTLSYSPLTSARMVVVVEAALLLLAILNDRPHTFWLAARKTQSLRSQSLSNHYCCAVASRYHWAGKGVINVEDENSPPLSLDKFCQLLLISDGPLHVSINGWQNGENIVGGQWKGWLSLQLKCILTRTVTNKTIKRRRLVIHWMGLLFLSTRDAHFHKSTDREI